MEFKWNGVRSTAQHKMENQKIQQLLGVCVCVFVWRRSWSIDAVVIIFTVKLL